MSSYIERIGNSGVLVVHENVRILIDGIFTSGPYFSEMPQAMKKAVFSMDSPYKDVDYLIFTHRHMDHFSKEYVKEYLKKNQVKKVLLPINHGIAWDGLESQGELELPSEKARLVVAYYASQGKCFEAQLAEDIFVRCYRSIHMGGVQYRHTNHYMIELKIAKHRLLFVADADVVDENFANIERNKKVDVVFVNPLFFQSTKGQREIERFHAEKIVLYHLPFEEDDVSGLIKLAKNIKETYEPKEGQVVLFLEKEQRIQLR